MADVTVSLVDPSYQTAQRESTCQAGPGPGFRTSRESPNRHLYNAARSRFADRLASWIPAGLHGVLPAVTNSAPPPGQGHCTRRAIKLPCSKSPWHVRPYNRQSFTSFNVRKRFSRYRRKPLVKNYLRKLKGSSRAGRCSNCHYGYKRSSPYSHHALLAMRGPAGVTLVSIGQGTRPSLTQPSSRPTSHYSSPTKLC
jgi:hypothetical protein